MDLKTWARSHHFQTSPSCSIKRINANSKGLLVGNTAQDRAHKTDIISLSRDANLRRTEKRGYISSRILDAVNFDRTDLREDNGVISIWREHFTREQIPDVPFGRCKQTVAENNVLTFENGQYYRFEGGDGKEHQLACDYSNLCGPSSDRMRGIYDKESLRRGEFWDIMSDDRVFVRHYYDTEEVKQYLNEAGIKEGFYKITVDDRSQEFFYSQGLRGPVVSKIDYDMHYQVMTTSGSFYKWDYEPGDIFVVDGEEYTLSEDFTLDVPYRIDIYNMDYPPRKDQK